MPDYEKDGFNNILRKKDIDSAVLKDALYKLTYYKTQGFENLSSQIKAWYNGYYIGNSQIYNPWSIANCINEKGLLRPYWVNISSNDLIKQTMARAGAGLKIEFEAILKGELVEALVNENISFAETKAVWRIF